MVEPPDYEVLDAARRTAGLSVHGLWVRYFAIGGEASHVELEGFLTGRAVLSPMQRDLVAHAINEAFMDKGRTERVAYLFDGVPGSGGKPERPS